jgi:hypothetical protein
MKSAETMNLTYAYYGNGKDRPIVFDTIAFINTLLEGTDPSWSEPVLQSFNSEVQRKMQDRQYWDRLSSCKEALDDDTKQQVIRDLLEGMDYKRTQLTRSGGQSIGGKLGAT